MSRTSPTPWAKPATEEELCERFAVVARVQGWKVYPETGGFDQLLVRDDGAQIGVEAKLRCCYEVLLQAVPSLWFLDEAELRSGPDYRAVLVPDEVNGFAGVAHHMGLCCFRLRRLEERFAPLIRVEDRLWPYSTRLALPDYVPDLPAGVPSPRRVSHWLIAAIRLCKVLRERGVVTLYDFRDHGLHMSLWIDRWIEWTGEKVPGQVGRRVRTYRAKPGVKLPDEDAPPRAEEVA